MPKIEGSAIIRVYGWVMLKNVDEGRYRIENLGDGTYQFYKPRGKRPVARHYIDSVDTWIKTNGPDLNGIEIIQEIQDVPRRTSQERGEGTTRQVNGG